MNPLAWPGPQFLAFFAALGAAGLVWLRWRARAEEADGTGGVRLEDPYLIAFLRGGANEAIRIATVSLVDRGLLLADEARLRTRLGFSPRDVRRPLEKALLALYASPRDAADAYADAAVKAGAEALRGELARHGLLPAEETVQARRGRLVALVVLLLVVAGAKLLVALSAGRKNVGFLIVLAIVLPVAARLVHNPGRTRKGDALLADLRTLFAGLKDRAATLAPGGASAEAVLLASVFGVTALPEAGFGYAKKLFPRASAGGGSSCGASCGSSCGSSCGGGCGGGCGGCGG